MKSRIGQQPPKLRPDEETRGSANLAPSVNNVSSFGTRATVSEPIWSDRQELSSTIDEALLNLDLDEEFHIALVTHFLEPEELL